MNRRTAVAQLQAVWDILNRDVDAATSYGQFEKTPYAQRALVRAHFALIEGLSYSLRQVTLASLHGTEFLTEAEVALLREERYSIDEKGHPKAIQQFLKFPDSLLFSIRCYIKNHVATFDPDTQHPGWSAMRRAVKVRDRVTHPKTAESLDLSNEDLQSFADAAAWWKMTMLAMFAACQEADAYWRKQLEDGSPRKLD
ncbi:MAG: hypothetical protein Q8K52_00410 [Thiobacillus sp.]|nr:hypothetical protein [Thiobacillus sp.]